MLFNLSILCQLTSYDKLNIQIWSEYEKKKKRNIRRQVHSYVGSQWTEKLEIFLNICNKIFSKLLVHFNSNRSIWDKNAHSFLNIKTFPENFLPT